MVPNATFCPCIRLCVSGSSVSALCCAAAAAAAAAKGSVSSRWQSPAAAAAMHASAHNWTVGAAHQAVCYRQAPALDAEPAEQYVGLNDLPVV
jgi:hypothetical protein